MRSQTVDTASLTERVKQEALRLGFTKVGVARAGRLDKEGLELQEWLERGYQGTMTWMARTAEKRIDPGRVLPGARSVVAVALNYWTNVPHEDGGETGKISRYAWGDDYHRIVTPRLEKLAVFLRQQQAGSEALAYVDTGPVMEKVWAARAGLGWQGKHTNLITTDYGSWVFLGVILTTAELAPDQPVEDRCGTCTACLEACPTQAIVEPYRLDASRCISYLTIEHRGPIAPDLEARFEGWIFGCDICQDVCPWNRFEQETREGEFGPRDENRAPKLGVLAAIQDSEFTERFRGSPVKRAKPEGMRRNAGAVLNARRHGH